VVTGAVVGGVVGSLCADRQREGVFAVGCVA